MIRICCLVLAFACLFPASLVANQYYFSSAGNDASGNGSLASPWQTVAKFNTLDLDPGDNVFFHAGDIFDGSLSLAASDTGTNATGQLVAPIVLNSYGGNQQDRAIFRSPTNAAGLLAQNNGGIELRNLEFRNGGTYASNLNSGIRFQLDRPASGGLTHFEHIVLDNVTSHGFHGSGLSVYASNNVGYDGIDVTNSEFYDNQYSGIDVSANLWTSLIHQNIHVDNVNVHNNPGFNGCTPHCGHGVVLGQVDGAVVEHSVAHDNGITAGRGNVGIWMWQSNNVTIQSNLSYANRSPLGNDGGGFDIDGGVTNSTVQYNVSHDNAGAGYLIAQFGFASPMSHNTIRYNLSVNDGFDDSAGITVYGEDSTYVASSTAIHNNTVVVDGAVVPGSHGPVWFSNQQHTTLSFINNSFVALNGAKLIDGTTTAAKANFVNNNYWTGGGPIKIGGTTYASIAAWATATHQETLAGQFVGRQEDPKFTADGMYRLTSNSPLINVGLTPGGAPWPAWITSAGLQDLYGLALPQGAALDIGAAEFPLLPGDFNRDGTVDAADYTTWRDGLDSRFTQDDFGIWLANFGATIGPSFQSSAVPEPTAALQLVLATLMIWQFRYWLFSVPV